MVAIRVNKASNRIIIVGHGITVAERFELSPGIALESTVAPFDLNYAAEGSDRFVDYAAVLTGHPLANFSLIIEDEDGGNALAIKGWNSLWLFHLLSLACATPCCSLYSVTLGPEPLYSAANRNVVMRSFPEIRQATHDQLAWAKRHQETFHRLIENPVFSAAMRCYGNAHYLFEADMRIMLLWSGIEGLLSVDSELNRRLALYAALILKGTPEQKLAHFDEVKKAYSVRSKAVHGGGAKAEILEEGYRAASRILVGLLARCVEIGRVPSAAELDALAVTSTVS